MLNFKVKKDEQDLQRLIYLAWHIEAFRRQKKLPKLKTLLKKKKRKSKNLSKEELIKIAKLKGLNGPWSNP